MPNFAELSPFDDRGRVQMVVETPRGSNIKFKYDEDAGIFTVSRSLALGMAYPFDWGFVPGTHAEDGDAVDALCLHDQSTYPGIVLPCRCMALVNVDQNSSKGRVSNPRVILAPDWQGSRKFDVTLPDQSRTEIETFFLNVTLFTGKDARITGWQDGAAAERFVREKVVPRG